MASICVIVPIYKVAPYIKECLDSIRYQTYTDFQAILVDDGSPDEDAILAEEYALKDKRIVCIHQNNGGLSAARNHGMDLNPAPYLTMVDSDDVIAKEYLEKLYINMTYDVDIVQCCTDYSSLNSGLLIATNKVKNWIQSLDSIVACRNLFTENEQYIVIAWEKLYRSELWEKQRYPEKCLYEDSLVAHRIFWKMRKMIWLPDTLYQYRMRNDSIMRAPNKYFQTNDKTVAEERLLFFEKTGNEELFLLALKSRISELLRDAKCVNVELKEKFLKEVDRLEHMCPVQIDTYEFPNYYCYKHPLKYYFYRLIKKIHSFLQRH